MRLFIVLYLIFEESYAACRIIRIAENIYSVVVDSFDTNLVHGTAEMKNNKLFISVADTGWWQSNTNAYTMLIHCQLDLATQQGTCRSVSLDAWPSGGGNGGGSIGYEASIIAIVPCP